MNIVALIPAHNEERDLAVSILSALRQTCPPDRIIVISDNSTDRTVQVAGSFADRGVEVVETVGNRHRKAGAMNQVLQGLLPQLGWGDAVLEMDADTALHPRYLERASARLRGRVGAVGPTYVGHPGKGGLLGLLQRMEYARFNRQVGQRHGRTPVLSGTATLASVKALRSVLHGRAAGRLPSGGEGWGVYNPTTGTEDYELTLCLRRLGYRPVAPKDCIVVTDVMGTIGKWHAQRLRWYWGALTNLRQHGLNRVTAYYLAGIIAVFAGIAVSVLYLVLLLATLAVQGGSLQVAPWWLTPAAIVLVERVWTVRREGPRAVLVAALFLPEFAYDWLRQFTWLHAALNAVAGAQQKWAAT